uniref:Uncharacterized protein n=1 Tax=Panagrolaimus sp. ES5 TaxID=591445 RepID=A0AC34F2E3_9BILA
MVIKLIAKDKKEKLQLYEKCKLKINAVSKLLIIEPEKEEFKMISAMFKWKFYAQKAIKGNPELIRQRFLSPLFDEIYKNNSSSSKLKDILVDWIGKLDAKEKNEYIQRLKAQNIYDFCYPNECELPNLRKRKAPNNEENVPLKWPLLKEQNFLFKNQIIPPSNFKLLKYIKNDILRMKLSIFPSSNKIQCYEYYWFKREKYFICCGCAVKGKHSTRAKIIKKNGKDVVQLNGNEHVCEIREYKKIIEKFNFELFSFSYGILRRNIKRLILFLDSSRDECYEYEWHYQSKGYYCSGCFRKKNSVSAKLYQREDGTEFVMLNSKLHVCEPRKFKPEKYAEKQIVTADKFKIFKNVQNGIDRSKMVIFTSSEKKMCYEYFWQNRSQTFHCCACSNKKNTIEAEVCKDSDGNDQYLKLYWKKHVCEPRKYEPEKFKSSKEIVESSNFKIFQYKNKNELISRLIVFCPTNKNLCYEFFWNKLKKNYSCCCCRLGNQVIATVYQKNDTKSYVELSKTQDVCELREFDPEKYKDDIIIQKSICCCCRLGNQVIATVYQKPDAKSYVELSKTQDACELREFDPEKYKDDIVVPKSMYTFLTTTFRNTKRKTLFIFTSEKKDMCYKFFNSKKYKCYICSRCFSSYSNPRLSASIQNEGKENEFIYLSNQKHVCEPFEVSTIINESNLQTVMPPNFRLFKREFRSKTIQHLAVFTNDEKSECFEYTWSENSKKFLCRACSNQHKTHVYAKFIKSDESEEDCIELCSTAHKCKPIKFIPEDDTAAVKIVKLPNFNDEIEEDCIELCPTAHRCKPIEFIPEDDDSAVKIVKLPNFKLYETVSNGKKIQRLTIFDTKNKKFGYIYSFRKDENHYLCIKCGNLKKRIRAYVRQDENGQNYVELGKMEHVCKMQKL